MENESTPEEGTKNKQTTVAMKREYTFYFLTKKKILPPSPLHIRSSCGVVNSTPVVIFTLGRAWSVIKCNLISYSSQ
jgi:hypothetical protein